MQKKLSRYGNSLALIIDKPILELLHINEDTMLQISTDGKNLYVTPQNIQSTTNLEEKISIDPKIQESVEKVMKKYGPVLKKLAKH